MSTADPALAPAGADGSTRSRHETTASGDRMPDLVGSDGRWYADRRRVPAGSVVLRHPDHVFSVVIGDEAGGEVHTLRIRAVVDRAVRTVVIDRPVMRDIRLFGSGVLWVRCHGTDGPAGVRWWDGSRPEPLRLVDESEPNRRLRIRGSSSRRVVVTSNGSDATRYWVVDGGYGDRPAARLLFTGATEVDVSTWRDRVVVLRRDEGRVVLEDGQPLGSTSPGDFVCRHLAPTVDELLVVGRSAGRQAYWSPTRGSGAVWTAPPAGVMLPARSTRTTAPVFLVSSPVHRPRTVEAILPGPLEPPRSVAAATRVVTAESDDGTVVPTTVFVPPHPGPRPLVVHVYGASGISLEGPFDDTNNEFLSSGVALGFCHVRGGGEFGSDWHHAATGAKRHRQVEDLLASLVALRSRPEFDEGRIVLVGASAGGLTAAAACLRAPDLLHGLQLVNPFVDPVSALLDHGGRLSEADRIEYGEIRTDHAASAALRSLSPTHTLLAAADRSRPLPRAFFRSAEHDARVDPASVRTFTGQYRRVAQSADRDHVVHRIVSGGHLAVDPGTDETENAALRGWLLDTLGVGERGRDER